MGLRTGIGWEKSQGVEMFFLEELGVKIRIRIAPHVEGQPCARPWGFPWISLKTPRGLYRGVTRSIPSKRSRGLTKLSYMLRTHREAVRKSDT